MKLKFVLLATVAGLLPATWAQAQTQPAPPAQTPAPAAKPAPRPSGDQATTVEGVTVRTDPNAARLSIDRRSYSVAGDLQATTGSVSDALRNVPGVQVDVQGAVTLRGSGVTILVDGKPSTVFSGEGQADALQNLPADQIERVEVITNPSAEFGPEGTGGVINLVTKQSRRQLRQGSVRANLGTDGRYNGAVSGSMISGPLTLSGSAGYRHNVFEFSGETERSSLDTLSGLFADSTQIFRNRNENDGYQLRGGADYDLDPKTRVSAELRYMRGDFEGHTPQFYQAFDPFGTPTLDQVRVQDGDGFFSNAGGTLRYRRQYAGDQHELALALSYDRQEFDRRLEALSTFTVPVQPDLYELIDNAATTDTTRLTADYNLPIGEDQRLKLGAEFAFIDNDFSFLGERGPDKNSTVVVPSLTNDFTYGLNTQAVYFTYQRPIGPLTAQLGLRVQADQIDIHQITTGLEAENKETGLYPTLHLQYDLTDQQQLTASYSRRIQRPSANDLNPYVIYVDPYNLRAGNPDLHPQITDSSELGWQYRKGGTFYLATAYLHDSRDGVTDVTTDIGGGVFLTTRENLAASRDAGLELTASAKLTPELSYQFSGDLHWAEIDGSSLAVGGDRSDWTWFGNLNVNWQATPKDFVQVSGFVFGDQLTPQGSRSGAGGVNLGYRHKFTDDLAFVFTAQDIFDTAGRTTQEIDTPILHLRTKNEFMARSVYVGFSYTFGSGPRRQQPERFDFGGGDQPGGPGGPGPG